VVTPRRGASRLGCLFVILILVTIAYFGTNVAEVYIRYYKINDAIQQEARFAATRDDDAIRGRLSALADSLGLPEDATHITVRRSANRISIETSYAERVELPMMVRTIHFRPHAEASF
jgi:hypothetical protein